MKTLIVGSKSDPASRNIVMNLMELGNFNFHIIEGDMTEEIFLDMNKINEFDQIIFVSKHQSEKKEKTLSIHSPGILDIPGKISMSSALFNKHLFEVLEKNMKEHDLSRYSLTLEATHHGPTLMKPSVFIEIGSTLTEWKDKRASFIIAKTIRDALENYEPSPYREIAIGIGGPHYCPNFNKLQLKSNVAFSHIIPKYKKITEEMIKESLEKTYEEVDFAILDWKGLGSSEEREEVIKILDKNYISWKKINEIKN